MTHVVIVGGGPGGYEAALVAAQLGASVTVVDRDGLGGSAVLTDCVPSKTLIATAELMSQVEGAVELGVRFDTDTDTVNDTGRGVSGSIDTSSDGHGGVDTGSVGHDGFGSGDGTGEPGSSHVRVDLARVNQRVKRLAASQSEDIVARLRREKVEMVTGVGCLEAPDRVTVAEPAGARRTLEADVVLLSTGAHPRVTDTAVPDGERILTWEQVYDLDELPQHLVVVGSGVTGAEMAGAYLALGSQVTLVSSRDRVLPGEDADAAEVLEDVFTRRGMRVLSRSRMSAVRRTRDGVVVELSDGRLVQGSHCLLAVGSVPNTSNLGLEAAGVATDERGFLSVDRVSRTSARGVYAAGDCTGVLMLASVAAMQGRIAMWHALGDAVAPLSLAHVSANVFTSPEIATVGVTQAKIDAGTVDAYAVTLPLSGNARAKMQGIHDGFVKLFCRAGSSTVVGGVVVAPAASELIHPVALAVACTLTVDQVANAFTVYPSLSGSIAEAARRLHPRIPA